MTGILIAAPSSGSGKTTVTLGLMRALRDRGVRLAPGKAGPDYIDPAFHTLASGQTCFNYDPWAMRPELMRGRAARAGSDGRFLLIEAMMGLHDASSDDFGSPADLAALLGLSVVFVVDCGRMAQSIAALVRGYRDHRSDIHMAGVILNKVGSDRHEGMLRGALSRIDVPVLGVIRQDAALKLPERHLGLVQAGEHADIEAFTARVAGVVEAGIDIDRLLALGAADHVAISRPVDVPTIRPPGQRIAIARDVAFAFCYPHLLEGWRGQGAEISVFSPLADEGPATDADAVYLPGGYPELHAGQLAAADGFRAGMMAARARGAAIYGECGGYMTLGDGIVAADGTRHAMLGFLPLETSFEKRRRHLGYRRVQPVAGGPAFLAGGHRAHEFHYASILSEGAAERLFLAVDAREQPLGGVGLRVGNVCGSFMHLIDREPA
ncbi:hydrogenobyrinic acid a,c-diamide synthase (glutamine-hydrolysing) /cobyrinate a,c-diamide synthase [Rhizobium sp. RU20A]|uniref:cobyrinate a,c-diamide synthase n=1 Tax=Rhizobium sp. RU20A TaxID=1907412 RepID=UPI00095470BF|nr:cobyrinate a,c-diamide synthase [Rhizobium sp. RU20A]SIQ15978.1 hydrogenobyrinic acid a,c-diamide synthase (glutamine-hydrolysing) /cobyrinate a,c-diamide synthase [Rhizobium sp. RU20A]